MLTNNWQFLFGLEISFVNNISTNYLLSNNFSCTDFTHDIIDNYYISEYAFMLSKKDAYIKINTHELYNTAWFVPFFIFFYNIKIVNNDTYVCYAGEINEHTWIDKKNEAKLFEVKIKNKQLFFSKIELLKLNTFNLKHMTIEIDVDIQIVENNNIDKNQNIDEKIKWLTDFVEFEFTYFFNYNTNKYMDKTTDIIVMHYFKMLMDFFINIKSKINFSSEYHKKKIPLIYQKQNTDHMNVLNLKRKSSSIYNKQNEEIEKFSLINKKFKTNDGEWTYVYEENKNNNVNSLKKPREFRHKLKLSHAKSQNYQKINPLLFLTKTVSTKQKINEL